MTKAEKDNPILWKEIVAKIKSETRYGTRSGEWSARKAQVAVKRYKKAGGGYKDLKDSNNSLDKWTKQDWRTKSGMNSSDTGERYLPAKAIKALSKKEYIKAKEFYKRIFLIKNLQRDLYEQARSQLALIAND